MNRIKLILPLFLLLLAAPACGAPPEPPGPAAGLPTAVEAAPAQQPTGGLPQTEVDVPRIPVEEARAAMESGAAVMVDVRAPGAYEKSHIAGAISVPLGEIERNLPEVALTREQWIITYCT